MSLVFRKIRKNRWFGHEEISWLGVADIQADALIDFKTTSNVFSLWRIESDRSNLNRIIAAQAAGSDTLSNLDYMLFDDEILIRLGLEHEQTSGDSLDQFLNERYHFDVRQMTVARLAELIAVLFQGSEKVRCTPKQVKSLLQESLSKGYFPSSGLKANLLKVVMPS